MINQELINRAKEIDIDFGGGQTLKGLLEGLERDIAIHEYIMNNNIKRAFKVMPFNPHGCKCCNIRDCGMTEQDCIEKTKQMRINNAKAELEKEQGE